MELNRRCSNCENNIIDECNICNVCGFEIIDNNINYVEEQFRKYYSQQRVRYAPNKLFERWLLQLQGKENVNISSANFNKILSLAKNWLNENTDKELSCAIIRQWLKDLSLTKYNSHITWLRIQIESECNIKSHSYELSNYERVEILSYFNKISAEFFNVSKAHNLLHYSYLIARILPFVIQDKKRLNVLLSNMHFNLTINTFVKNDNIWRIICERLNYQYIPLSNSVIIC